MIVGQLVNWRDHLSGDIWEEAFDFLMSLDADSAEGDTELQGKKLFGRVMAYSTRGTDEAILESHREYIDIQISLNPARTLQINTSNYRPSFPRQSNHSKNSK